MIRFFQMAHKYPTVTPKTSKGKALRTKKLLISGVLGLLLGACIGIVAVGVILIKRSVEKQDVPIRTTPILRYDVLYEDVEEFLGYDLEASIGVIESALQKATNDFDLAIGHYYLARAYRLLGNDTLAAEHYEKSQDLLLPFFSEPIDIRDLSTAYFYAVSAADGARDYDSAQRYYQEMKDIILPMLAGLDDAPMLADVYLNLIKTASFLSTDDSDMYYRDMRAVITPLLDDLVHVVDIGETYTALMEAATLMMDFERLRTYSQDLIDTLKPMRDQLVNPEDLASVNKHLGDAESVLGHYQFAAVYYHDLVDIEPKARNILLLAVTYNLGGNHGCAYLYFQELLEMERRGEITAFQETYREIAETSSEQLVEVCGECGVPNCP